MKLYYFLKIEDYINFNINHFETSKILKIAINVQRFGIPLIFLAVPLGANLIFDYKSALMNYLFTGIAIVWVVGYKALMKKFMIKHIKKTMSEDDMNYTGERVFEMDKQEIRITTKEKEEIFLVKDLKDIQITEQYAFLYKTPAEAYIVPFNSINKIEQKEIFIRLLQEVKISLKGVINE
ncbi:hypothetical protein [uncultured Clostridium sp.]|uniref:hypothetical protein n=1 Tax=uncultured Clostridium sp. TaxID=59620 RepID=UPI002625EF32|nr:hypothetical protein [uncultured Clostridium sp.]